MIRRAEEKDIKRICALLRQILTLHADGRPDIFKPNSQKYSEAEISILIGNDLTPVFVYEDETGLVLGYAFCVWQKTEPTATLWERLELYIDDLCVDESARGKGIGTKLMQHVMKEAEKAHAHSVTLNAWTLNPEAIAFYEKCGMQPRKLLMEYRLGDERNAEKDE